MQQQVTLFVDGYFANPFDATCFVSLEEKGVAYTTSRALLRDNQGFPRQYQTKTGIPRVPALQHGDFWITESIAIADYLDNAFPDGTPLFPRDPRGRARALQLMAWVRIDLQTLRTERPWWTTIYPSTARPPLSERARTEAAELLALVDWLTESGAFATWSIAHVDLALATSRLLHTEIALTPSAQRLLDANYVRPSLRTYLDHPRPPNPPP